MDNVKMKHKRLLGRKPKELDVVNRPATPEPSSTSLTVQNPAELAAVVNTFPNPPEKSTSRAGFRVVHDPLEPVVDIIFLHSLTGDPENTWTRRRGRLECFWPLDLLPEDIRNARVAICGYDTSGIEKAPFSVVSANTLEAYAQTLCNDIAILRKEKNTPIIFVVHSLGGIVCKTALLRWSEARTTVERSAHFKDVCDNTRAIAFMGTPHQGSSLASWGAMLASLLGYARHSNKQIVQTLEAEAPHLNDLQMRFSNLLEYRKQRGDAIDITCFYEELSFPDLGTIIPKQSATLPGYDSMGIHEDHSGMTKFGGDDSPGYKRVIGELHRWVTNLTAKKPPAVDGKRDQITQRTIYGAATVNHHGHVADGGVAIYGNQKFENSGTTHYGGTHHHGKQTA